MTRLLARTPRETQVEGGGGGGVAHGGVQETGRGREADDGQQAIGRCALWFRVAGLMFRGLDAGSWLIG